MSSTPSVEHRYETVMWDSDRWSGFTPRDGDIVVCTSYKAGTTWTQMLCAVLIHQTPTLPAPLAQLSRWMDMKLQPVDEILEGFEAQGFRRVIKTHTPLDGIPYFENVSYVYCGRDPRDVFMSMQHHMSNIDMERAAGMLAAQGLEVQQPPPLPDDVNERFAIWMTHGVFPWEHDGAPYWSTFNHVQTFWRYRRLPNFHFLHFADLKRDLEGEMRRLAAFLEIEIAEELWPELVRAATFDQMKANADRIAPEADHRIWKSTEAFFNKGENDQWREALSKKSQELYQKLSRERYDRDMLEWMERGSFEVGLPADM
jgi:aryl sulfotransferase